MLDIINQQLQVLDNDLDIFPNLNNQEIILFINQLKKLLFNKIYQEEISISNLYQTLDKILSNLTFDHHKITDKFFKELPNIKTILITDINAFYKKDPAVTKKEEIIYTYNTFNTIYIYRIANLLSKLEVSFLPRILAEYAHSISGVDIHPKAEIGNAFFIDHGTGIVIGETTIIGNNISIYQGVTIGAITTKDAKKLKNQKRHPTILDNVVIYANATILGGNTIIGKNSVIGANTFIIKSIKENSIITIHNN